MWDFPVLDVYRWSRLAGDPSLALTRLCIGGAYLSGIWLRKPGWGSRSSSTSSSFQDYFGMLHKAYPNHQGSLQNHPISPTLKSYQNSLGRDQGVCISEYSQLILTSCAGGEPGCRVCLSYYYSVVFLCCYLDFQCIWTMQKMNNSSSFYTCTRDSLCLLVVFVRGIWIPECGVISPSGHVCEGQRREGNWGKNTYRDLDYYRFLGLLQISRKVYVMGVGPVKPLPFYFHVLVLCEIVRVFHEPNSEWLFSV